MSRSTRMFEIIQLLRSARAPLTAQSIADDLEVSKRTVYRDIAALQSMRIPIDGEAGIGYIIRPGFDLPPLMFTAEEVEAIAVGLALLGRTGDKAFVRAANSITRKIAEVLPETGKKELADTSVFASQWHEIPKSAIDPLSLRESIREERALAIKYKDEHGASTSRTILPIAVLYYIETIVLAAWCELRNDFRHFRIDRIEQCTATDNSFPERGSSLRKQWRSMHDLA